MSRSYCTTWSCATWGVPSQHASLAWPTRFATIFFSLIYNFLLSSAATTWMSIVQDPNTYILTMGTGTADYNVVCCANKNKEMFSFPAKCTMFELPSSLERFHICFQCSTVISLPTPFSSHKMGKRTNEKKGKTENKGVCE